MFRLPVYNESEKGGIDLKEYLELFLTFAKIGVMTFGGGAAMLPMLQRELLERKHWVSEEELMDYYAIGQCTPGIIAVNTATFVGEKRKGVRGGIAATLGMIFPSFVIILILATAISAVSDIAWVQNAFAGIRACVCVLIVNAVIKLAKKSVIDVWTAGIFAAVFGLNLFLDLSPIWFVLLAAAAGVIICVVRAKRKERGV